ncbi:hypothetical protein KIN20_028504 [Parelaphostrongylus tenuis]|uniref:Uncharacterized protein n=1 Tax=Parelaphostrongylus tenuis TaxID=148309 RepID=A0AAD5WEU7_PARTN|nr:hypothetical protein KIN20_028504 [Parelaphostrongylus tenuis]
MKPHCIIVDSTVTALCDAMVGGVGDAAKCDIGKGMKLAAVSIYTKISGTLTTTNIIMANWSKEMWQGVVNRAARMLASGAFRSNFFLAFATVN